MTNKIVILGPSSAGKTGLVASLQAATHNPYKFDRYVEDVSISPESDDAIALFNLTTQSVLEGQLPFLATEEVQEYTFTAKVPRYFLGIPWLKSFLPPARFHMWDPPGGHLFPLRPGRHQAEIEQSRRKVVDALKAASGFLICASAFSPKENMDRYRFFANLGGLFNETRMLPLPARRVAIALTKIDQAMYEEKAGRAGLRRAMDRDPIAFARQLLGTPVIKTLKKRLDPATQVGFCFTSAYGFLEDSGIANYDSNTEGMLAKVVGSDVGTGINDRAMDHWRPFRVLAPFVFLAGGHATGVRVVRAGAL